MYKFLFRAHLDSCYAANPVTGEREFVEQLVDARKLKVYSDMVVKANGSSMVGDGPADCAVAVCRQSSTSRRFSGADGAGGVDYGSLSRIMPSGLLMSRSGSGQKAVRQEWRWHEMLERYRSVTDDEAAREEVQREKDRESGMSPAEVIASYLGSEA